MLILDIDGHEAPGLSYLSEAERKTVAISALAQGIFRYSEDRLGLKIEKFRIHFLCHFNGFSPFPFEV